MGTNLDVLVCENFLMYKDDQPSDLIVDYKNKFENELQWRESGESLGQAEANENENANIIKYKI